MEEKDGNQCEGKPPFNKWVFALILAGIVAFMFFSIAFKIAVKGP